MSYTNQVASAACKALGMPSGFAAEKEPVSPSLPDSTAAYMQSLSAEALRKIYDNPKASSLARRAALQEHADRISRA